MTDLLDKVLAVHGGLHNWRRVTTLDFRLTVRGRALEVKQQPNGLRDVLVKIDGRRQRTLITPFPVPGSRGVFEDGRVRMETSAGAQTSGFDEPRKSFAGYTPQTPWNDSQFLYFIGYALHNYMTMPFLLANDGVQCEEIARHEEHGESWRVLTARFPPGIHVHCREQKFYFNDAGHLVRNDYAPEVSGGSAAHYTFDHNSFDGFVIPTHRRVVFREPNGRSRLAGPSIFRLDIESVVIS
jgi:diadenosine tetraphosphatase ApaH/serine/threonine PP2A family protein phosphatase